MILRILLCSFGHASVLVYMKEKEFDGSLATETNEFFVKVNNPLVCFAWYENHSGIMHPACHNEDALRKWTKHVLSRKTMWQGLGTWLILLACLNKYRSGFHLYYWKFTHHHHQNQKALHAMHLLFLCVSSPTWVILYYGYYVNNNIFREKCSLSSVHTQVLAQFLWDNFIDIKISTNNK